MANRLPKYYIVKGVPNNTKWDIYIQHLNDTFKSKLVAGPNMWYGYDGNPENNGTDYFISASEFKNNPTILTLEEFFELKGEVEPPMIKVTSTHKETVKSVGIHIEIEGKEHIEFLYYSLEELAEYIKGNWDDRVIKLLDGIKSQLKG